MESGKVVDGNAIQKCTSDLWRKRTVSKIPYLCAFQATAADQNLGKLQMVYSLLPHEHLAESTDYQGKHTHLNNFRRSNTTHTHTHIHTCMHTHTQTHM